MNPMSVCEPDKNEYCDVRPGVTSYPALPLSPALNIGQHIRFRTVSQSGS